MARSRAEKFLGKCLLVMALWAPAIRAQSASGAVNGTVRDVSGAVVPDATVIITHLVTNVERNTLSNTAGTY
jgi:hypothetical protein